MADALLQIVLENLNSLIGREIRLISDVNKEMRKLSSALTSIQAVLQDAEEKQLRDHSIQDWLQKLKDAVYVLDDILDDISTELISQDIERDYSKASNKVLPSLPPSLNPKTLLFRRKICKRMKEIGERLDEISAEKAKFHLRELNIVSQLQVDQIPEWRRTTSVITQSEFYGRDEDKKRIVEFLVRRDDESKDLSIYSIVGIGGLGKTTLTQHVYNDEEVDKYFQHKAWVCISENFSIERIVRDILQNISGQKNDNLDFDSLLKQLQNTLSGKRYLLVLDDVWNEDEEKWNDLKNVLPTESEGTCILVTTRLLKVANIMGTFPPHNLSRLSEQHCWSLFRQRAFGQETEEHPTLVEIGKNIVKKCGGSPLAAKSLGSFLRFNNQENYWRHVENSPIWNLSEDQNNRILPALRLSYLNLPVKLRACFSFCAIFPKDHRIYKGLLVKLWMANGLISTEGVLEVEDVGEEVCNQLYWRSFFQEVERDEYGNMLSFKMHDMIHDLAQSIVKNECVAIEDGSCSDYSSARTRHIAFFHTEDFSIGALHGMESLRTFLHPRDYFLSKCYFSPAPSLRALHLSEFPPNKLSSLIINLKHLRYLKLTSHEIEVLPECICSLFNLQTLDLSVCSHLKSLPEGLTCLRRLRHLYLYDLISGLTRMPQNMRQLSYLRTLNLFIVGSKKGHGLSELRDLKLGGKLGIEDLQEVTSITDAREANLLGKHLQKLELQWGSESDPHCDEHVEQNQVLEALEPNPCLQILRIDGASKVTRFPNWMMNNIIAYKDLMDVYLYGLKRCSSLPPFGRLPSLRSLMLVRMDSVQYIDDESYNGEDKSSFPSLESVCLFHLHNLEGISREGALLPRLSHVAIQECPKLIMPSNLPLLKKLNLGKCNELSMGSISRFHGLTALRLSENDTMTCFPGGMLQHLTHLENLSISRFSELEVLPMELKNLGALKTLDIKGCQVLESFPEQVVQGLTSLQNLGIKHCPNFRSLPQDFGCLSSLQCLKITSCPELVHFPEGLDRLVSLRELTITSDKMSALPESLQYIPSLKALRLKCSENLLSLPDWLGKLASLQSIKIMCCPKLTCLPTSIQNLDNLKHMIIDKCAGLEKRCEKEKGEDWHLISHVPKVAVIRRTPTREEMPKGRIKLRDVFRAKRG